MFWASVPWAALCQLCCQAGLFRLPIPAALSRLSFPSCPAPALLSLALLSQLSCHCFHVLAVQSSLSSPLCPVQADLLSSLPRQTDLSRLTFFSSCPVPVVMSQMHCPYYLVMAAVLFRLSCHSCFVLLSCSSRAVLSF
jgi:hypothetical protein